MEYIPLIFYDCICVYNKKESYIFLFRKNKFNVWFDDFFYCFFFFFRKINWHIFRNIAHWSNINGVFSFLFANNI